MIVRRESSNGANDLGVVYRPCKVNELLGNEISKKIVKNSLDTNKVPHTQLFTGDAGCGKTTVARIVALGLNCETNGVSSEPCLVCNSCRSIMNENSVDVREINVGQSGGKDYVDAIVRDLVMAPFNSRYKVIIFDEAHELTTAAKDLLLKPLESGYDHVYFIFCTNQPNKLRSKSKDSGEPFLDRCTVVNFGRIDNSLIKGLLTNVCEFEGFQYTGEVINLITEESQGVPRNALVWLNQIAIEGTWSLQSAKVICGALSEDDDPQVLALCQALNKGSFKEAVDIFEKIKTIPVENIRISVDGYFVSCLKRSPKIGDARKFSSILNVSSIPIYEQGKLAGNKFYNYLFKITDIVNDPSRRS